ncbi:MAG: hypothetical protein ACI9JL_004363 [Paracoccaceae bacterium]|jgi:hypothetical protein
MTAVWSALQTSDLAVWINFSRWIYAGIATAHVLSIAVLVGSILTLDLRLIGFARWIETAHLARLIVPVAGTALGCAVISGGLLFIGRAAEYASFGTFQIKIALIVGALAMTAMVHRRYGLRLERAGDRQCRRIGVASIALWLSVVVAGRMIAFVHG